MTSTNLSRRQRKAALTIHEDVPLSQPDRSGPKGKTLYDLAAERQEELFARADAMNAQRAQSFSSADGPIATAVLHAITLSMLHFTLDVLVHHQYAQSISWPELIHRTAIFTPCILLIVYILYTPAILCLGMFRQVVFLVASTVAGCYLVRASHREAYIAVMRRAPPLGTLLVWFYVEMRLTFALVGVGMIGAYMAFYGFPVL